jgi:cytochrome c553
MKNGTHDVSRGIATGLPETADERKKQERAFMLDICAACHTRNMAKRTLEDADRIVDQSRVLIAEAQSIVEALRTENLLWPSPVERPPHPLFGKTFVIGPHMLYENLSTVESLFFRMKQFYYMNATKGAFHQNPDYTHWYGNAPLKLTLSEIRSEAYLLRSVQRISERLENLSAMQGAETGEAGDLKKSLRQLSEKRNRGEISEKEFQELKDRMLNKKGL